MTDTGIDELRRRALELADDERHSDGVDTVLELLTEPTCGYRSDYLPRPCRLAPGHRSPHDVTEAP